MTKKELLELATKYEMKPMELVDESKECYGERVIVHSHQIGFMKESTELIPELEKFADDAFSSTMTPVTREYQPWDSTYVYKMYAPRLWFEVHFE